MQEWIARRHAHCTALLPRRPLLALALLAGFGTASAVDVRTETDYVAIVMEGEDADERNDRWVLTRPDTPALSEDEDPDGNHSDQAVGNAYLEVLPDTRVRHEDELIQNENFWGAAGVGPRVGWNVNFPNAGRYYVHVRALSTGTEDNGLFVGLNGSWPDSGRRLQLCGAGAGWLWTSRQRDSGGAGPCGVEKTIWLDIPSAGEHVVQVSAREDGFELDRLMLIHDLSDNTRICSPRGEDDISCRNGSIENVDAAADVSLAMSASTDTARVGDEVTFTFGVVNEDKFDPALDVMLDLAFNADWELVSNDERCEVGDAGLSCELGEIAPEAEENAVSVEIGLEARAAELLQVAAEISSSSEDLITDNDSAFLIIDAVPVPDPVELTIALDAAAALETGDTTALTVRIDNISSVDAENVQVALSVPELLTIESLSGACERADDGARCEFGVVAAGQDAQASIQLQAERAGKATIGALATLPSEADVQERASREITVNEPVVVVVEPETEPEPVTEIEPGPTTESTPPATTPEPEPAPQPTTDPAPTSETPNPEQGKRSGSGSLSWQFLLLGMAGIVLRGRRRVCHTAT